MYFLSHFLSKGILLFQIVIPKASYPKEIETLEKEDFER